MNKQKTSAGRWCFFDAPGRRDFQMETRYGFKYRQLRMPCRLYELLHLSPLVVNFPIHFWMTT